MLRQLARLTRPIPAAGPEALAVGVYSDRAEQLVVARESGYEGVACVDDSARLLDLVCEVWARTKAPWAERWAKGLLEFVLWMQEPDGRWLNFVVDWEGTKNRGGVTSAAGENFWHARAMMGVSAAWLELRDDRAADAMARGLDHVVTKPAPPDVRAIHVLTAHRLIELPGAGARMSTIRRWSEELLACRMGDVLMNSPYERGTPHLWAHIQEGTLARSATLLEDPSMLDVAVRSAEALLVPVVEGGFARTSCSPFDVSSCVFSLDRLWEATGEDRWHRLATDARGWFDGRNPAGRPVYDATTGRVADGVDEGRISENSGAEANIEGAVALLERVIADPADPFGHVQPL
jgi:hypothetical protein